MNIIELGLQDYVRGFEQPIKDTGRTPEELEIESREKESSKELDGGVNESMVIKLKDDGSVIFKPRDGENRHYDNDQQQYKRERAAYLIDRFLGIGLIPPTVIREIDGRVGSAQQFIPKAKTGYNLSSREVKSEEWDKLLFLDYLIANKDRHPGNYLYKDKKLVAIDHGLAFKPKDPEIDNPPRQIPYEYIVRVKEFMEKPDQKELLKELLLELLPENIVDAFVRRLERLALLSDYEIRIHF